MEKAGWFAVGILAGVAIGVALTGFILWLKAKIDRGHSFQDFAAEIREAKEGLQSLFGSEIGSRRETFQDFAAEIRDAKEGLQALFINEMGNRRETFGTISERLNKAETQTGALLKVTRELSDALSHPRVRGTWGERMVEDVLRPTGFREGINYLKQSSMLLTASRPDFTFLLPRGLKVNLDAKFPLDNYLAYCRCETDEDGHEFKKRFLGDVRRRIKEVVGKGYINSEENTVDFVLVFIPNEQIYSFVNTFDPEMFDHAIRGKVILCSPWTLYPVLSIIRIAIDNFVLEKTTAAMLPLMGAFGKQWESFNDSLDKMGRKLSEAQKEYENLVGTRHRQLDKVLERIELLREKTDFHDIADAMDS